ncbi:hypothetical protein G5C51_31960 [Streptomyces sp. A7024]|uniref:Uncharacterized protein n=1 Tax=Streptomyces coryli TaxID=1128680 RepID=A0A6G4UBD1_9ACTN|nr:hypothetical protein [Streptomyces coryli]NGN68501.1 hypothetical protein [Streptomyces coryli]
MSTARKRTLQRMVAVGAVAAVPLLGAGQAQAAAQEPPTDAVGAIDWVKKDMESLTFTKVFRDGHIVEVHAPLVKWLVIPMPM